MKKITISIETRDQFVDSHNRVRRVEKSFSDFEQAQSFLTLAQKPTGKLFDEADVVTETIIHKDRETSVQRKAANPETVDIHRRGDVVMTIDRKLVRRLFHRGWLIPCREKSGAYDLNPLVKLEDLKKVVGQDEPLPNKSEVPTNQQINDALPREIKEFIGILGDVLGADVQVVRLG